MTFKERMNLPYFLSLLLLLLLLLFIYDIMFMLLEVELVYGAVLGF